MRAPWYRRNSPAAHVDSAGRPASGVDDEIATSVEGRLLHHVRPKQASPWTDAGDEEVPGVLARATALVLARTARRNAGEGNQSVRQHDEPLRHQAVRRLPDVGVAAGRQ